MLSGLCRNHKLVQLRNKSAIGGGRSVRRSLGNCLLEFLSSDDRGSKKVLPICTEATELVVCDFEILLGIDFT